MVLDEQLAFERLVAELSSEFINLPAGEIDAAIRRAFERTAPVGAFDRATLYRLDGSGRVRVSVTWSGETVPPSQAAAEPTDRPWTRERLLAGDTVAFAAPDDLPSNDDRRSYVQSGVRAAVAVPLTVEGRVAGAVEFARTRDVRSWDEGVLHRLRVIAGVFGQALARQERDDVVRRALAEVERLRDAGGVERTPARETGEWPSPGGVVGASPAVRRVLDQVRQVAATDSTVLLLGETGTGKELFAQQIHDLSRRRHRPMVRVNCAAIPATLIESELFGREKGAFTGALARQIGRFELADQSTIFLDEIGDLPADVQVKLLRVLEERQIERLGSPLPITVDTRIVAATHQDLEQRIRSGAFRDDLYYRLNVFPIRVPPLRERIEDIPLLVRKFVSEFSEAFGKRIESIAPESLTSLQRYPWPGNIRELRNVVERAMILAGSPRLTIAVPQASTAAGRRSTRLVDVEREHIGNVLESTGWRIRGAGGAAERLGLKPTTLETRMARLGLRRPGHA